MVPKLLTVLAVGSALVLGVKGCSSGPRDATAGSEEPAGVEVEEVVVEEPEEEQEEAGPDAAEGLTNQEACELFVSKGMDALSGMDATDYQAVLDAQLGMLDAIEEAGESAADPAFRATAEKAYEAGIVSADFDRRIHVESDTTVVLDEALAAQEDFGEAYSELLELCSQ